jgi:hypothetical protein
VANPKAPAVKVMYAVKARLDEVLVDRTGIADLNLRWARNRYTSRAERPCLAIAFVSDAAADDGSIALSDDEAVQVLALDLILDLEIETEASAQANEATSTSILEFDPSGLDDMIFILKMATQALRECCADPLKDTTDLGRKVDWIQEVSLDDDEELPDDDGRLVSRINVIYRTSSWDPMLLLEREAP